VNKHETINSPNGLPALEENLQHNHAGDGFTLDGAKGELDVWQIKRVGDVDVPYWDVQVDPSIIKDHGDMERKSRSDDGCNLPHGEPNAKSPREAPRHAPSRA